ncbi:hypothetical protein GQ53DRAFT_114931 [Thozetella sp. PMI_491]|nr:hypothetical protein GQ53DRAFT_114931 [Thozetella sp. PMI_491]
MPPLRASLLGLVSSLMMTRAATQGLKTAGPTGALCGRLPVALDAISLAIRGILQRIPSVDGRCTLRCGTEMRKSAATTLLPNTAYKDNVYLPHRRVYQSTPDHHDRFDGPISNSRDSFDAHHASPACPANLELSPRREGARQGRTDLVPPAQGL